MSEEVSCPRCKTSKYRNPSLKLLVNVCGHSLCDNCVELLFVKGSAACPQCQVQLRRNNFRVQLFENNIVEKDVDIRKKILRDFNKKEHDFESFDEYNEYLEFVEDIIYNMTNNVDVESTKRKIEQYKKDNAEFIAKYRSKLSNDEEIIENLLEQEREHEKWRKQIQTEEDEKIAKLKNSQKEALVDELMFSDLPANQILAQHSGDKALIQQIQQQVPKPPPMRTKILQDTMFSTGIKVGKGSTTFMPLPKLNESDCYVYTKPVYDIIGPRIPDFEELEGEGYLNHIRNIDNTEKAGGFLPVYPCYRAIQDAFCGLFYEPRIQS